MNAIVRTDFSFPFFFLFFLLPQIRGCRAVVVQVSACAAEPIQGGERSASWKAGGEGRGKAPREMDSEVLGVLAFAVPFLLFTGDVWLHGPVPAPLKHVGLAASVLALPTMRFEAFVAAELLWLALIAYATATAPPAKPAAAAEESAAAVAPPVEAGPPALSPVGEKLIADALKKAIVNLDMGENNCDGKPWKLQLQRKQNSFLLSDSSRPYEPCSKNPMYPLKFCVLLLCKCSFSSSVRSKKSFNLWNVRAWRSSAIPCPAR